MPLGDSYYTVDGRVTCFDCSDKATTETPKQDLRGLPLALVFGAGAAVLGTIVYLLILKFTGYEIGLIAIAVGWLVGRAMMKGSKGRGGLAYQVLAVVLTYHSIIFSYVVVGVWTMLEQPDTVTEQAAGAPPDGAASSTTQAEQASGQPGSPVVQESSEEAEGPLTLVGILIAVVFIYFQVLFLPFLDGLSNLLGIAIIAFGLWEAWRHTRLVTPEVAGPFSFSSGPQAGPPNTEGATA